MREKIAVLRAQGFKITEIAKIINRDKSAISREPKRNKSPVYDCYLPHKADKGAKERQCKSWVSGRDSKTKSLWPMWLKN
ncbi:MAG: helix-turn-helix domain-containing protein [Deltaproteobacteria bacterium]|nr:helix-turn-helix domain-containing protein [Deltaproteobacteria bacterium]MBI3756092.1 helix-turn-helix domain-containing protein [Deltaproteobacteria bacterium]